MHLLHFIAVIIIVAVGVHGALALFLAVPYIIKKIHNKKLEITAKAKHEEKGL